MTYFNKKGQLTVHYVALIILVLSALTIMFPVVRNSLYGYFKSLEESIEDSESDVNLKAPPGGRTGSCICLDPFPVMCGGYDEPKGNPPFTLRCPIGFKYWFMPCPGCSAADIKKFKINQHSCKPDPKCCSKWRAKCTLPGNIECCGANIGGWAPLPKNKPKYPPFDSCPDGFAHSEKDCGSPSKLVEECVKNLNCDFFCPKTLPANTTACDEPLGSGTGKRLTLRITPWTVVAACSATTTVYGGCYTICKPPRHVELNKCVNMCLAGQAYSFGCSAGRCLQGSCALNFCTR